MTKTAEIDRLAVLEKRVHELSGLVHLQDAERVKIEKAIGVIDQQLIRTDAGLHEIRIHLKPSAKPIGKPKSKAKAKPVAKAKSVAKGKPKVKAKAKAKKKK
jgi:hypothetical protein